MASLWNRWSSKQAASYGKPRSSRNSLRGRPALRVEGLERRALLSADLAAVADAVSIDDWDVTPAVANGIVTYAANPSGYTPDQLRHAYGLDQIVFGSIQGDGTGQTIAIVDAYNDPSAEADLHVFDQTFGLPDPPSFRKVSQTGSTTSLPRTNAGWSLEIALDIEWAHAMAPGASILLVEANSPSTFNLLKAVDYARSQPGVTAVSMSWGGGETSREASKDFHFTTPSGHSPVTFLASSGDSGTPASWPSASANIVSVGGTNLQLSLPTGTYVGETGWSGSGGGYSAYVNRPTYQNGFVTNAKRGTPDVALNADPATGVPVYTTVAQAGQTGWFKVGGTSASSPEWAGIIAIANQGRALAGKAALGDAHAALYSLSASDFHDITVGNNGSAAGPGYDTVTGRGTPLANLVVSDLVGYSGLVGASSAVEGSGAASNQILGAKVVLVAEDVPLTLDSQVLSAATPAVVTPANVATPANPAAAPTGVQTLVNTTTFWASEGTPNDAASVPSANQTCAELIDAAMNSSDAEGDGLAVEVGSLLGPGATAVPRSGLLTPSAKGWNGDSERSAAVDHLMADGMVAVASDAPSTSRTGIAEHSGEARQAALVATVLGLLLASDPQFAATGTRQSYPRPARPAR